MNVAGREHVQSYFTPKYKGNNKNLYLNLNPILGPRVFSYFHGNFSNIFYKIFITSMKINE